MVRPMSSSADHSPYWFEGSPAPGFAPLDRDERADVVVVGGGIAGLTAAYLLARAGKAVILVERGRCAEVDSGHTTAHLTMVMDTRLVELSDRFGRTHAQAAWDAGLAAIAQIDEIIRERAIHCGFAWIPGYLHAPGGQADAERTAGLMKEATLAHDLGFDATFVGDVPFIGGPGIRFDNQARLHPRAYLAGLARAVTALGGRIYEQSPVDEVSREPRSVQVNGHTVRCEDLVLATHNPLAGLSGMVGAALFQTKLALYTSYVVAGRVPRGEVPDALYWDTSDPYHYIRLHPDAGGDVVILGGEDHKTGQEPDTSARYERLEQTLRRMVPGVELSHRWAGQVIETPDGLPYLGQTEEHQYVATGFAGNGMTFGTLGAMIACDGVLGRTNPWAGLFSPARSALGGLWDYLSENADYPYYMIRDRFAGTAGRSLRAIKRGDGGVIERDGSRLAVYRDDSGAAVVRSAVCTHMGCVVGWNASERTWDCPCHGSRFRPDGTVLAGPAESPLATAD